MCGAGGAGGYLPPGGPRRREDSKATSGCRSDSAETSPHRGQSSPIYQLHRARRGREKRQVRALGVSQAVDSEASLALPTQPFPSLLHGSHLLLSGHFLGTVPGSSVSLPPLPQHGHYPRPLPHPEVTVLLLFHQACLGCAVHGLLSDGLPGGAGVSLRLMKET